MTFQRIVSQVRAGQWKGGVESNSDTNLVAAGSTIADALVLRGYADINVIGTAAASTGVLLPSAGGRGDEIVVFNQGANAVLVYPNGGGAINALSASAGYSLGAAARAVFVCYDGLNWMTLLSA